jgi:uncharacterized membrane protein
MVLGIAVVGLAAWEVYVISTRRETISRCIRKWSLRVPMLPAALGGILCHVLWSLDPTLDEQ